MAHMTTWELIGRILFSVFYCGGIYLIYWLLNPNWLEKDEKDDN